MNKYNVEEFNSGEAIQRAIERLELTQGQFAYKLGMKTKNLQSYLDKDSGTSIKTLMEWCDKLGCDLDFLVGVQTTKRKDAEDICKSTGIKESTIDLMKKEFIRPQETPVILDKKKGSGIPKNALGVSCGVTTAELLNELSGQSSSGKNLKVAMIQYITESVVCRLLKDSINDIVEHHNSASGKHDEPEKIVMFAEQLLHSIRRLSSLSSLTMTGKVQTGFEDDLANFCEGMSGSGFDERECKVIYDYLQSRNRLVSLEQTCHLNMIQFLDELSEGKQLSYTNSIMGIYDVTSTKLYGQEGDRDFTKHPKDSKKVMQLKDELKQAKMIQERMNATNCELSAELSELRWKVDELQNVIDHIPEDKKELTALSVENDQLKELVKELLGANQGLSNQVDELQKELDRIKGENESN